VELTTIPAAVAHAAREFGDAPALAEPGGPRISYRELQERVVTVARALSAEGVAPGDQVAIWSPNTYHWVLGALGALQVGATLVPVSTRFTGHEALDVISRSRASALIVAGPFLGTDRLAALRAAAAEGAKRSQVAGPRPRRPGLIVRVPIEAVPDSPGPDSPGPDSPGPDSPGTPGDGAIGWDDLLDRAAAVPAAVAAERAAAVSPGDVSDIMFSSGTTGRSKGAMTAHRQSLAVDPQIVARTSGRATAGFEVRLAAPDGRPAVSDRPEAVPGETGEILLRGPNLMLGYLDDPEATGAAIDSGGWLHTGDVGHLDPAGNLTITDRLKDMYICGGFNVYPAEVEQMLARLDGVAESAVIGVADERLGEVGRAYVVTRPGHVLDAGEVLAFCRERLANYKVPRQVVFRAGLPRNPAGKVLKRLLREEPT
jgi:acyl-CoA synthetase (AMP-forming)/AMP-acid ligase II